MKLELNGLIGVNCYIPEQNGTCYIIDPGYEPQKIISYIKQKNLTVLGILLTHAHVDHIGAVDCFKVPVFIHTAEKPLLFDDEKNGFNLFKQQKSFNAKNLIINCVNDGDALPFANTHIHVIHTPGHTAGSVCYKYTNTDSVCMLFSGDTLFKGTAGRTDFPTGSDAALQKSLKNLFNTLDGKTRIYPGHGESSTIEYEARHNPFVTHLKL